MEISDDLICLYSAKIHEENGQPMLDIPEHEIELSTVAPGADYKIAIYATTTRQRGETTQEAADNPLRDGPPVEIGEEFTVEIESIGDEGDGVARIGPGYVIFVPDTEVGEHVTVEIETVLDNVGFAEVLERHEPRTFD